MKSNAERADANHHRGLSKRQVEVIQLVAGGRTDKEIAGALGISEETVAHHLRTLFHRYNLHCRAALVAKAADHLD